ncbi:MAG: Nramp family divalent metal transporter [Pirellulales bacterium]
MADEHGNEGAATRAAGKLPPWTIGKLPEPPAAGWRLWIGLIGPGVVLAGTSIGSGEWLFGPAVTAQYGATLLWLALLSILFQVFCNLMMMRYTIYCGEPIVVGGLRTWPGPGWWILMYAVLDLAAIWPYNASNAAVPLAAAWLGRLPAAGDQVLVRGLGFALFLLSFVPLIFGGTVYRMLEKIMTFKLVVILTYLTFVAVFMVSISVVVEVASGFVSFGVVPLRAESVVAGRHFTLTRRDGDARLVVKGTFEGDKPTVAEFKIVQGDKVETYKSRSDVPERWAAALASLLAEAQPFAEKNEFFVAAVDDDVRYSARGRIDERGAWQADQAVVEAPKETWDYATLDDVPAPYGARLKNLVEHRGFERVSFVGYMREHGHLPPLDWAMLASFCAIAGAGGLSNTLFSNYARDKGWGMGKHVGAIPSAVGGLTIQLSHTGKVFHEEDPEERRRWKGWLRHIIRDQVAVWLVCSVLGMALPCMLSLEFIRNATVAEHRVAAMVAEGMSSRYPAYGGVFWILTLLCGFLILAPGQVSVGDQIARRWTDIIWSASPWARRMKESRVGHVYYSILAAYAVWGVIALWFFPPLAIAKIGAVLGNIALGCATLHALHANRTLLHPDMRPHWFLQLGTLLCAAFFFALTGIVVWHLF